MKTAVSDEKAEDLVLRGLGGWLRVLGAECRQPALILRRFRPFDALGCRKPANQVVLCKLIRFLRIW